MSSLFDMNRPERLCPICMEVHSPTTQCKYDTLVRNVHTVKGQVMSLLRANREAVDTAKAFQKIIVDIIPETERLIAVEKEFIALVNKLKASKIHPTTSGSMGVNIDDINALLPPDVDDKIEFFAWLKKRHNLEDVSEKVPTLQERNVPAKVTTEIQK